MMLTLGWFRFLRVRIAFLLRFCGTFFFPLTGQVAAGCFTVLCILMTFERS
jgi:hypothetical protein